MAHWTDNIKLDEAVDVANLLGLETDGMSKRDLIENIMVRLMGKCTGWRPLVREPEIMELTHYDTIVGFYITCHKAIKKYLRNLTRHSSCRESAL